jgi:uncharacterized surface protein with fasciclin (FAS1) repeats
MLLVLAAAPVCAKPPKMLDLTDAVGANKILTQFAAMIQASGLGTFTSSRGPFTLFAPVDSAFDRLAPGEFQALLDPLNHERLQRIVLFHLVNGKKWMAKDLIPVAPAISLSLVTCEGAPLVLRRNHAGVQVVMKAHIIHADIHAKNGVIHLIDTLLVPADAPPLVIPPPPAPPTNAVSALPPETNAAAASTNENEIPVAPSVTNESAHPAAPAP